MTPDPAAPWRLPRVLIADGADGPIPLLAGLSTGILLQDLELEALVERAAASRSPIAVDVDSVRGLKPDDAAVAFVVRRLGASVVISRRPQLAVHAVVLGAVGLVQVLAFDSTGLQRSLTGPSAAGGVGTSISPGLVLPHLQPEEVDGLPRPLLAHGLIVRPADAITCLGLADAIVLRPDAARFLASTLAGSAGPTNPLTTIAVEE